MNLFGFGRAERCRNKRESKKGAAKKGREKQKGQRQKRAEKMSDCGGFFMALSSFASATFYFVTAFGIYRVVNYFISKDKSMQADFDKEWNTGQNILIGHDGVSQSVVRSLVDDNDNMINGSTFNRVDRRFREIAKQYGPEAEVHLHLRTPGGELFYAMLIAHIVYDWKGRVVAHIHSYSASGGTLIALACDEIRMDSLSVLGPIDPQIPAKSDFRSVTNYAASMGIDLQTLDSPDFDDREFYLVPAEQQKKEEKSEWEKMLEKAEAEQKKAAAAMAETESVEKAEGADKNAEADPKEEKGLMKASEYEKMLEINMRTRNTIEVLRTYKQFLKRILSKNYAEVSKIIDFFWAGRDHSSPIWREDCREVGLQVTFVSASGEVESGKEKEE